MCGAFNEYVKPDRDEGIVFASSVKPSYLKNVDGVKPAASVEFEAVAALPPMLSDAAVPVKPVPAPVNDAIDKTPKDVIVPTTPIAPFPKVIPDVPL